MLSDRELLDMIENAVKDYSGQADELAECIGMMVLGNLMGWRVVRLVCSRQCWERSTRIFGDPKQLLPERGRYAHKSLGLTILDKIGGYWAIIRGSRVALPMQERKALQ
jgi:hypothetical protein